MQPQVPRGEKRKKKKETKNTGNKSTDQSFDNKEVKWMAINKQSTLTSGLSCPDF